MKYSKILLLLCSTTFVSATASADAKDDQLKLTVMKAFTQVYDKWIDYLYKNPNCRYYDDSACQFPKLLSVQKISYDIRKAPADNNHRALISTVEHPGDQIDDYIYGNFKNHEVTDLDNYSRFALRNESSYSENLIEERRDINIEFESALKGEFTVLKDEDEDMEISKIDGNFVNNTGQQQTYKTHTISKEITTTNSTTSSSSFKNATSLQVEVGGETNIPFIANGTVKTTAKTEFSIETSDSKTSTESIKTTLTLPSQDIKVDTGCITTVAINLRKTNSSGTYDLYARGFSRFNGYYRIMDAPEDILSWQQLDYFKDVPAPHFQNHMEFYFYLPPIFLKFPTEEVTGIIESSTGRTGVAIHTKGTFSHQSGLNMYLISTTKDITAGSCKTLPSRESAPINSKSDSRTKRAVAQPEKSIYEWIGPITTDKQGRRSGTYIYHPQPESKEAPTPISNTSKKFW